MLNKHEWNQYRYNVHIYAADIKVTHLQTVYGKDYLIMSRKYINVAYAMENSISIIFNVH